jgi:LAS superfamily LD-carboxypeptidase LdcB
MPINSQQAIGIDQSHLVAFKDTLGKSHLVNQAIVADLRHLLDAAAQAGVAITLVSAYRSFERQLAIWNEKWQGHRPVYSRHGRPLNIHQMSPIERYKAISLWSAMPGFSRHHWGTDLDIFSAEAVKNGYQVELTESEFSPGGPCEKLELWLQENLPALGFFRPYREYRQGVSAEPWHISHRQTATQILRDFDYLACKKQLEASDILAGEFIREKFSHYQKQYFCNICEVDQ